MFSSALASAGKEINTSIVQPGMTRAQALAGEGGGGGEWQKYLEQVSGGARSAAGWAGQKAGESWDTVNGLAKQNGIDFDEQLRRLNLAGGQRGYGQLERAEDGLITPHGGEDGGLGGGYLDDEPLTGASSTVVGSASVKTGKEKPKDKEWDQDDEWKDF